MKSKDTEDRTIFIDASSGLAEDPNLRFEQLSTLMLTTTFRSQAHWINDMCWWFKPTLLPESPHWLCMHYIVCEVGLVVDLCRTVQTGTNEVELVLKQSMSYHGRH